MRSQYRLGVDAGGTFTDFVLAEKNGDVRLFKVLSTPSEPTLAIENGLKIISEQLAVPIKEIISNCDLCINGTTVGLNALIQHKGAKAGLICTSGHQDSIEIRLGHKEDGYRYDAEYPPAVMLVPRYLRYGVEERVLSTGKVHTPLNEDDVRKACELFIRESVDSVAISFIWSVLHPQHEKRAAEIVREMMPNAIITIGNELYPQIREYTRTSTAITNAYLAPIIHQYVNSIDEYFSELGAKNPVRYFQSNGGLAIGEVMSDRSVYAINSGPASAPQAGLYITSPFGHKNVITVDMGGTSFDITLTRDGSTNLNKNIDFLRYRVGVPMIQVETLGAGGGSIGWIDEMGLVQMGPQSAGSDPGPACYQKGGTQPTVTDANLVLGYLDETGLVGGTLPLSKTNARKAIQTQLAAPLGISVEKAAYGMFTIVNNNMVNGIRAVSVQRGYDPRDFVLVGAGGATGAHITALAREMGINTIIMSKLSSGLCAYGQIISDVKYNYMATIPLRLDNDDSCKMIDDKFSEIETQGIEHLKNDGFENTNISIERSLEMRYVGQIHECLVEIDYFEITSESMKKILRSFHDKHRQLYTYSDEGSPVEVVNIESTLYGHIEKPELMTLNKEGKLEDALKSKRQATFSTDATMQEVPVYDGDLVPVNCNIEGPAIIEEVTTTLVIEPGWVANLHESGSYVVTKLN